MNVLFNPSVQPIQVVRTGLSVSAVPVNQPPGTVTRIPIDESRPDASSIIATLQMLVEQFGREPWIRAVAESLITTRVNNNILVHINTLADWVQTHVTYVMDPDGAEYVQSPVVLIQRIASTGTAYGDCDDHVLLLGSLIYSLGIKVKVAGVKLPGALIYNHVMLMCPVNGQWLDVDPCAKDGPPPHYSDRLIA